MQGTVSQSRNLYIVQAGSTVFSVASLSYQSIYEMNKNLLSNCKALVFIKITLRKQKGFPPTFGQIPLNSGYFDWLNWLSHMVYRRLRLVFQESS